MTYPSRRPTKSDYILILVLHLLAVLSAFLLFGKRPAYDTSCAICTVTYDGVTETYPLSTDRDVRRTVTVRSQGCTLLVTFENDSVRVSSSDCPDGVCVDSGSISYCGQTIVCVPARVTISIEHDRSTDEPNASDEAVLDAVAGGAP